MKTKKELLADLAKLDEARSVGNLMSNLCFNLSQSSDQPIGARNAAIMRDLYKRWDAVWAAKKL